MKYKCVKEFYPFKVGDIVTIGKLLGVWVVDSGGYEIQITDDELKECFEIVED